MYIISYVLYSSDKWSTKVDQNKKVRESGNDYDQMHILVYFERKTEKYRAQKTVELEEVSMMTRNGRLKWFWASRMLH